MSKKIGSSFHEYSLSVTGFLGGITFAAMVLIIESQDKYNYNIPYGIPYPQLLITGTAIISIFFIISTVGAIRIASGEKKPKDSFSRFNTMVADAGLYGLIIALLPGLILPFSFYGAVVTFATGMVLIFAHRVLDFKSNGL